MVSIEGRGADNFDNVRVIMSAGTNTPDRVGASALSYLSPHVSPRLLAGVEGG
jgi:hypothetical protein